MANTFSWIIPTLDAKIKEGDLQNVIYCVHWIYIAKDETDESIMSQRIGVLNVKYNEGEPFIPYDELTKETVINWLELGLDVSALQDALNKDIELIKNPVDEHLHPDWN
jgi:hypothetical protein